VDEIDEHGDAIFRFQLGTPIAGNEVTLHEFYRAHLHEVLAVVRFYFRGNPVLVDSFAFLNEPYEIFPILPSDEAGPSSPDGRGP
jgi:hypothetical protein